MSSSPNKLADNDSSSSESIWPVITPSKASMNTTNPIRDIFDNFSKFKICQTKELISVAIGDPTKYMDPPDTVKQGLLRAYKAPNTINSYCPSPGTHSARVAVSKQYKHINCTPDDVVITGGCMQALVLSITSLCNDKNDIILLPSPGWAEYETIINRFGFSCKYYKCDPANQWQIDIADLESNINAHTKAILVTNPSNPCGSLLTYNTTLNVLKVANKYKVPIIADEIYSKIVFPGQTFVSFSMVKKKAISQGYDLNVPVLVCSGMAKNYNIPGWKVGWIVFDDKYDSFKLVKKGIKSLLTIQFGPSSVHQYMVEYILANTKDDYWKRTSNKLYKQCKLFCELVNEIPELTAIPGVASFYVMVKIHLDKFIDVKNDMEFFEKLLAEQGVFILPGYMFKMDGYFRAVICANSGVLKEVVKRLREFCDRHRIVKSKL